MKLPKRYIQILTLLLMVLIATPCSIKKMYSDFPGAESSHKGGNANAKLQCQAFVAGERQHAKKEAIGAAPAFKSLLSGTAQKGSAKDITSGFFLLHKEKVPTYLLHRTLLI